MKVNTKQAIELAGSSTALASLLGIGKSAVSLWGDSLPDDRAKALIELRPEWFPDAAAHLINELKTRIERLELVEPKTTEA
jgi:DNA-binding transcriptional regulator Cro